jgi:homoserine dehydrogenase
VDRIAVGKSTGRPLRVALLGCGTVGGGVYKRLAALPELFEVVGVATRNVDRAIDEDVPVRLITTHLDSLISESPDVVVELLGGIEPALSLVTRALLHGCHVVTANKALLASHLSELESIADAKRSRLLYSAAVGGVVPTLETVRRARAYGELSVVSGILNGTTNFILDELANGTPFSNALRHAQQLGYAEANPQFDLDGTDAAQKLILLAREAFDVELAFDSIRRVGIDESTANSEESGKTLRVIAQCRPNKRRRRRFSHSSCTRTRSSIGRCTRRSNRLLVEDGNGQNLECLGSRGWSLANRPRPS